MGASSSVCAAVQTKTMTTRLATAICDAGTHSTNDRTRPAHATAKGAHSFIRMVHGHTGTWAHGHTGTRAHGHTVTRSHARGVKRTELEVRGSLQSDCGSLSSVVHSFNVCTHGQTEAKACAKQLTRAQLREERLPCVCVCVAVPVPPSPSM